MTSRVTKTEIWSDFPINLTTHPITGDIVKLVNGDAVKRSVKNLILSEYYERPYSPYKGSSVKANLFELVHSSIASDIRYSIEECINNWEPRAKVHNIEVVVDDERNGVDVEITFSVVAEMRPIVVEVFLERVR